MLVATSTCRHEIGIILPSLKIGLNPFTPRSHYRDQRFLVLEGGNLTKLCDGKDNRQTTLCVAVVAIEI